MGVKLTCLLSFVLQGLDNVSSATLRPFNSDINTPRIDSYRFSMANLEGKLARTGFIDPVFHPEKSVGDFHTCQTRDASPRVRGGKKSLWRRASATRAVRLFSDFPPLFSSLHARFSSPRQVNMTASRGNGGSLTFPLNRSAAPFAITSWILTAPQFLVPRRFREGRKRSSPAVREFFRRFLRGSLPRGFRSEEALIARQRSIGETANKTRYISPRRKNLFRPFISGLDGHYRLDFMPPLGRLTAAFSGGRRLICARLWSST